MYFSIPDTQELNDGNGSTYVGFNVHINGVFHCTVRYKQMYNLHEQLRKEYGADILPTFPPKKLLPLTGGQLEERRASLEKYIQILGQDSKMTASELLSGFLLSAQQETTGERKQEINIDVYTMTNHQISMTVLSTDRTSQVLSKACSQINLPPEYASYFALFLIRKEDNGDIILVRKLQDFESPYISHKSIQDADKIVIRRNYWLINYDLELMTDPVALNLLYTQTVSDIEKGWILCTKEVRSQMAHLQARLAKREYIDTARTLKYYGYMQFQPCYCDYPSPQTKVLVAIGGQELSLRIITGPIVKEGCFKVTRMRCWRITAIHNKMNIASNSSSSLNSDVELSFEYLMSKDNLQWVSIMSSQAILMSICLQSMVDELLLVKNGLRPRQVNDARRNWSYMKRDGSSQIISLDEPDVYPTTTSHNGNSHSKISDSFSIKRLQEKFSTVSFKSGKEFVENHAFEGISDDDL
ncbi:PREDICTED: sorting nexin-17 [Nicrophorus vespilloides]|uniref:Sorting nexin-17 n=1 Tax=Nicrophorus vespilloides TaxID=110193 RepID=A0ABM1MDF8_NICVS|nr:PREDICTED: sorting nexin-17 [Nicrophorus vespilloides]